MTISFAPLFLAVDIWQLTNLFTIKIKKKLANTQGEQWEHHVSVKIVLGGNKGQMKTCSQKTFHAMLNGKKINK